jgi:hypothetical protein
MYPIMGILFGIFWVILAFFTLPIFNVLLIVVAICDIIFGIFLVLLPVTTYLGLFYIAAGAFTVAAVKGTFGLKPTFTVIIASILFLLTGGLTTIQGAYFTLFGFSFSFYGRSYIDMIPYGSFTCHTDLNVKNWDNSYWNLDTRCENYALFVAFCVFLLFLLQPVHILSVLGLARSDHSGKEERN